MSIQTFDRLLDLYREYTILARKYPEIKEYEWRRQRVKELLRFGLTY